MKLNRNKGRQIRFTAQKPIHTTDDYGSTTTTWSNAFALYGVFSVTGADERQIAHKDSPTITYTIVARYNASLTNDYHLLDENNNVYEILGVFDPTGTKLEIVIKAQLLDEE